MFIMFVVFCYVVYFVVNLCVVMRGTHICFVMYMF